jgi:Chaperone of endosialidase
MSHAFKFCVIVISAVLGLGNEALAQCFVCSDAAKNTAVGTFATTPNAGSNNTASGYMTLYYNGGTGNTADGYNALYANTTGDNNVAAGASALYANTTGANNTAAGASALHDNTSGSNSNASGNEALFNNTTGSDNNAMGHAALFSNTTGTRNSAVGTVALYLNTTGGSNDAVGYLALYNNTTGNNNVGIGYEAGYYLTNGNNNIDIGSFGTAADSGIIRIGQSGVQNQTYIAGIASAKVTGSAVYLAANGQLGILASSERYKTRIAPMGSNTEKLERLRPVSFHLKSDPNGAVQYGLIAEEVDKVYPELVIRDNEGKIQGVRYDELAPMLLNEMQKQQSTIAAQTSEIHDLEAQNAETRKQLAELGDLKKELNAALRELKSKDSLVAQR